ncbi:dihydrodipicolinate synthase family protein [Shewanella sp. 10N.286.45.A1]|uniref:dihydrodipicolinate synthase family protein n=1 Tax=Shewanella sp. 10N.286.45.A1 TaxID=3229694 RepID=UPI003553DD8E
MEVNRQGVLPVISTQFYEVRTINYESNARMLEDLIRDGIDGIIALGMFREKASLCLERMPDFIKNTVKTVKGRILVLSGCIENTAEQSLARGSENVRKPRLALIGKERAYVEKVIVQ